VFDTGDDLLALLRGRSTPGHQKGWMNRTLEDNPVPAIWITNSTDGMDPAFLRRFLLPVACTTPPRSVRRRIAESHLGDCGLPPALLDELADDAALAPAQLGAARRLLELRPETAPEPTVRHGLAAMRSLLHGAPTPPRRRPGIAFDVAFLNLAGGIAPSAIVQALDRTGHASLCFYGPPGTGKSAFAEILAEALDRELIVRRASDLISPYVGETEQNLARLFRDSDPAHSLLLLDEVDSFLGDRREARHSWERTQVNELLQQMEHYPASSSPRPTSCPGSIPPRCDGSTSSCIFGRSHRHSGLRCSRARRSAMPPLRFRPISRGTLRHWKRSRPATSRPWRGSVHSWPRRSRRSSFCGGWRRSAG
jgi:transitional endoplasmic reticulum ATPase